MLLDVTQNQEDLKPTAYRISKGQSQAEDMVQGAYLQALEYGIDELGQLIAIITKPSFRLYRDLKRGIDTPWEREKIGDKFRLK